jgi:hypothetical protein
MSESYYGEPGNVPQTRLRGSVEGRLQVELGVWDGFPLIVPSHPGQIQRCKHQGSSTLQTRYYHLHANPQVTATHLRLKLAAKNPTMHQPCSLLVNRLNLNLNGVGPFPSLPLHPHKTKINRTAFPDYPQPTTQTGQQTNTKKQTQHTSLVCCGSQQAASGHSSASSRAAVAMAAP